LNFLLTKLAAMYGILENGATFVILMHWALLKKLIWKLIFCAFLLPDFKVMLLFICFLKSRKGLCGVEGKLVESMDLIHPNFIGC